MVHPLTPEASRTPVFPAKDPWEVLAQARLRALSSTPEPCPNLLDAPSSAPKAVLYATTAPKEKNPVKKSSP